MGTKPHFTATTEARRRLRGLIHNTPTIEQRTLSDRMGRRVFLKCEHLQKTGSFKVRGILNHLLQLPAPTRDRGVITISAGNAAQAVAWAAATAGIPATVVMPAEASPLKAQASREYGAEVILHGNAKEAFELVFKLAEECGLHFVHPFDDTHVIEGHATVALEIVDAVPDVADVVVPCGGGGLVSGVALGMSGARPAARVWCVEPEGAPAMKRSVAEGHAVHLEKWDTIADGLAAPMAGELNYAVVREHVERCLTVGDDEIQDAMGVLFDRTKQVVEPAGAAGLAALLTDRIPGTGPVVVVLSGGNVDRTRFAHLISEQSRSV
jgi:threonine dehydratase